jgi:hypothetical protein
MPIASASPAPAPSEPANTPPGSTASPEPQITGGGPPQAPPAWTERGDVASGPEAREDHTWTVNGDGSVAYLFGGRGAAGAVLGDLWQFELETDTWTELRPTTDGPPGRFGHTANWVPDVGLVVWSGQGSRFFDDIWRYDPAVNAWAELPSLGAVPAARYGSCASLGPDGELWISHGFTADDGRFADTVSYNFAAGTWTDRTPAEGDLPVARCLHDCYWSATDKLVLYGGQTTGVTALGDLWMLDFATGLWSHAPDPVAPARNLYALSTYGSDTILFGGGSVDGGFLNDAWLIIDENSELTPFEVDTESPPARSSATLTLDAMRDRYLLFGGMNADGVLDDLWELDRAT